MLVMDLIEVVKGDYTSEDVAKSAVKFVNTIHPSLVLLRKEISGFIAYRIVEKMMDEGGYMLPMKK